MKYRLLLCLSLLLSTISFGQPMSMPPPPPGSDLPGHFPWQNNQLFFITPDEFTKIDLEDILAKKNGWR